MKFDLHADYGQSFVPVDDVRLGWNLYRATATFISYFESNWLNNPIYMRNCYDSTLSDDARTSNHSEGSNNALNMLDVPILQSY